MMTKIINIALFLLGLIVSIGVLVAGVILGAILSVLTMIGGVFTVLFLIWFGQKDFEEDAS